jgi:hypothetical protein
MIGTKSRSFYPKSFMSSGDRAMTKQTNAKKKDLTNQQQNEKTIKRSAKERSRIEKTEDEVAVDSDQSFPASDPPSWTGVTGPGDVRGVRRDVERQEKKR